MQAILERIKNEPVLVVAFVQALIGVGLAFGLELSTEQRDAIIGFTLALLAVMFGVRAKVTPVRKLQAPAEPEPPAAELRGWR